jgi:gliding motility-associated lipoprotein GldH
LATNDRWTGSAMDDIYEHRILLYNQPVKFRKSGTYTVQLEQVMRENPLKHVLNLGIRIEKMRS